jgi:indole-3-glycerol phosphate synthase
MSAAVPDILSRIVATKRVEVEHLRASRRSFRAALEGHKPAVIAELKKASPSKGTLIEEYHPGQIAHFHQSGGAAALSVLTDRNYFQGSLHDLHTARAATHLPVLRKDFMIDEVQIAEAMAAGADAILLIAAIMDVARLRALRQFAETLGLDVLVEAHDEKELTAALESGATIVGVNNRDLRTFQVSLETSIRLAPMFPKDVIAVSESGIQSRADIDRLMDAGYRAFLIGEHLMKAADPMAALRELTA